MCAGKCAIPICCTIPTLAAAGRIKFRMMDWPNMAGGLSNGSKPDYSLQKGKVQKRFAVLAIWADFAVSQSQ